MRQLERFRAICDELGQAQVHRMTNYSRSTISKVYHEKYEGSPEMVIQVVLEKLGGKIMQTEKQIETIPDGFMKDSQGRLVRIENIREIDLARDELVKEILGKARDLASSMSLFKRNTMGDIAAFVDLAAEKYGAALGGKKGNVTLRTYDNQYRVQLAVSEYLVFDEGLQAAKALIDECINEWTSDSSPEIRTLINDAFQVDQEGRINTGRVLGLRRLDIRDEKWRKAIDAISDSLAVAGSKSYVRIYERDDETGKFSQLALDLAAI